MTAAVYRSGTPSLNVPESQNTAPVLEFNCLYTHDIRRKQKRWQDGFLRFHTFNKRVMVYDVPRNFIGDAHWKSAELLQDGDEVVLEKGGVMVQVAESVGQTETDLTELRQSKNKKSSEKGSSPIMPSRPTAPQRTGAAPPLGLKHRSLNALLGTPKGPIGKATLPAKSPFEERQASVMHQEYDENRPLKRQRLDQAPAWNVVRTARPSAASPTKETPLWARTAGSIQKKRKAAVDKAQRTLPTTEVIDLCEEENEPPDRFLPGFSSDALAPSSPPRVTPASRPPQAKPPLVRSSSPAFQTQKASAAARATAKDHTAKATGANAASETTRFTETFNGEACQAKTTKQTAVEGCIDVEPGDQQREQPKMTNKEPTRKTESRSGRTLRIAASAPKKKMLLCQNQLAKSSSRSEATLVATDKMQNRPSEFPGDTKRREKTQQEQLRDRLARIAAKEQEREPRMLDEEMGSDTGILEADQVFEMDIERTGPQPESVTTQHQNALELAELDQMLMPVARSPSLRAESPLSQQDIRQLRRVVSEATVFPSTKSNKRIPGAPVRYTPSPAKKSPSVEPTESEPSPAKRAPYLPSKARSEKPIQRAVSLNTASNGTSTVILRKPFQLPKAPKEKAVEPAKAPDPWSREAFDLFTWRPPGFDEENWCIKVDETVEKT